MMKLWVQLIVDNKMKRDLIYDSDDNYSREGFFDHLVEICYRLQIPTPILLNNHFDNFEEFNNMRFIQRDFVERFDYDKMIIENAIM